MYKIFTQKRMKLMAKQEKTAAELYREERKARIAKAAKKNVKKHSLFTLLSI